MTSGNPQSFKKSNREALGKQKQFIIGAIVACVLIVLGIVQAASRPDKEPKTPTPVQGEMNGAVAGENESAITKVKAKVRAEAKEVALREIAEHEEMIQRNWTDPDTPDRLIAIGNLYQYQLEDYYSAIENYRSVVDSFPGHNKVPQVYIELASCYERLGDEVQARYIYQEMVDKLDPSLQRTQYAKVKLDGGTGH